MNANKKSGAASIIPCIHLESESAPETLFWKKLQSRTNCYAKINSSHSYSILMQKLVEQKSYLLQVSKFNHSQLFIALKNLLQKISMNNKFPIDLLHCLSLLQVITQLICCFIDSNLKKFPSVTNVVRFCGFSAQQCSICSNLKAMLANNTKFNSSHT